jgi:1-acyl-sn-glycerol-3-phosphate acyltransferase
LPVIEVTPRADGFSALAPRWIPAVSVVLRSILFNVAFYLTLVIYLLAELPALLFSRHAVLAVAKSWGRTNLRLLKATCGISVEWRGLDKIPQGPLIVAAKHQSVWETFALLPLFADPTFIVKRELMWIPLFGWCLWRAGMISIDRGKGSQAIAAMTERAKLEIGRGRQIIIFPEGTRRAAGAAPAYKYGVAKLYAATGAPCLPVALNSGLLWPRRSFRRHPGVVRVEILDPIPPGLDAEQFFVRLQNEIETATARLVAEGKEKP